MSGPWSWQGGETVYLSTNPTEPEAICQSESPLWLGCVTFKSMVGGMYPAMLHIGPLGGLCLSLCLCIGLDPELGDGVEATTLCVTKNHLDEDAQENFPPSLT